MSKTDMEEREDSVQELISQIDPDRIKCPLFETMVEIKDCPAYMSISSWPNPIFSTLKCKECDNPDVNRHMVGIYEDI